MTDDLAPPGVLRVDIAKHKRSPGTRYPLTGRFAGLEGMALPSVDVAATEFEVDLQLEMIGDQLSVAGSITADWEGLCRRCVETMNESSVSDVKEIFELDPSEGETYLRERDFADLRPMIIEAVSLSLPVVPLCREDCPGPDPTNFPSVAPAGEQAEKAPPADPRWAGLAALEFDDAADAG